MAPSNRSRPTFSGLDGSGISGEAADLNNDGLLDLLFAADPDNFGVVLSMARYASMVYGNNVIAFPARIIPHLNED